MARTVQMNERELRVWLRKLSGKFKERAKIAAAETLDEMLKEARIMSSGRYSRKLLRKMGHPYATRHVKNKKWGARVKTAPGVPYGDPAVINAQSGVFRSAWKIDGPVLTASTVRGSLVNDSRVAEYLRDGTDRMIKRPIQRRLTQIGKTLWQERLQRELDRAIQEV